MSARIAAAVAAAAAMPRKRLGVADSTAEAATRARSDSGRAWPMQRPLGWQADASSSVNRATSPNSRALHDLQVLRTRYEQCRRELSHTKSELAKALAAGERWRIEALSAAKREAEWRLRAHAVAEAAAAEVAAAVRAAREILRSVETQRAEQSPSRASAIANRGGARSSSGGGHGGGGVTATRVALWSDAEVERGGDLVVARLASPEASVEETSADLDDDFFFSAPVPPNVVANIVPEATEEAAAADAADAADDAKDADEDEASGDGVHGGERGDGEEGSTEFRSRSSSQSRSEGDCTSVENEMEEEDAEDEERAALPAVSFFF